MEDSDVPIAEHNVHIADLRMEGGDGHQQIDVFRIRLPQTTAPLMRTLTVHRILLFY